MDGFGLLSSMVYRLPSVILPMAKCSVHDVETLLRCGKCDKPICPDCMMVGPAGMRCRDCASVRSTPLFHVSADRLALGAVAGLVTATAAGYVMAAAYAWGFVLFWLGFLDGLIVGEIILRCIHRKRGPTVEITAAGCVAVGFFAGLSLYFVRYGLPPTPAAVWGFLTRRYFELVGLGMAIFGAVSRTRFF